MVVLPSQAAGDKLIYMRHYKAKIEGDVSRVCSKCLWHKPEVRLFYNFGCKKPAPSVVNNPSP